MKNKPQKRLRKSAHYKSQWGNYSDTDLLGALNEIEHDHNPLVARLLIGHFYERMHDGLPINEKILRRYVEYAFGRIVRGKKSADVAFGLKRGRGEYRRSNTIGRDAEIACCVILLIRKGWKWRQAIGDTAHLYFADGMGDKAVEKAHADFKTAYSGLPDDELAAICPGAALIIKP